VCVDRRKQAQQKNKEKEKADEGRGVEKYQKGSEKKEK
jgi:hypothetical protein